MPEGYFESEVRDKMDSPDADATENRFPVNLGGMREFRSVAGSSASRYKIMDPREPPGFAAAPMNGALLLLLDGGLDECDVLMLKFWLRLMELAELGGLEGFRGDPRSVRWPHSPAVGDVGLCGISRWSSG